jgi:extradiol dioxygenase family protein
MTYNSQLTPFHLAIRVHNLEKARQFYGQFLGFLEGRSTDGWIDWNFFGHQLVTHLEHNLENPTKVENPVDGHQVPVPHFGVVLEWEVWHKFADHLRDNKIKFVIEPYVRFKDKVGEQATMFFLDPSGNALEFKAFRDINQLFAK